MAEEKLTQKQENFCLAYIKCGNASQAYRESYNAENMKPETINNKAYAMLTKGGIRARVEELRKMAQNEAIMTRQEALIRLSTIARSSILDIADFSEDVVGEDENGDPVTATNWRIKNGADMSSDAATVIKSVTATKQGPKLEIHDQMAAMKQLADLEGWNSATKHDHTSSDGSMTPKPTRIELVAPNVNSTDTDPA